MSPSKQNEFDASPHLYIFIRRVTEDFSNLKMVGHVFIVEDAKDLAQIVRDVTRYGGSFRPEEYVLLFFFFCFFPSRPD